jgi:hypothetical protein
MLLSKGIKIGVQVKRLLNYPVLCSTVEWRDCPSEYAQIRENVGYRDVRLQRSLCTVRGVLCVLQTHTAALKRHSCLLQSHMTGGQQLNQLHQYA